MNTTTPTKPRRLLCSPLWGASAGLKPITIDGWENVPLINLGLNTPVADPLGRAAQIRRQQPGSYLLDYEHGLAKTKPIRAQWVYILRDAKPGDIAYGVDTSVQSSFLDDLPQNLIYTLRHSGASFGLDLYLHAQDTGRVYRGRCDYRKDRLRQVERGTGADSVQILSPLQVRNGEMNYETGECWSFLNPIADVTDVNMSILLFAPAATPAAHAVVEEATRTLAGMIGGGA